MVPRMVCGRRNFQKACWKLVTCCADVPCRMPGWDWLQCSSIRGLHWQGLPAAYVPEQLSRSIRQAIACVKMNLSGLVATARLSATYTGAYLGAFNWVEVSHSTAAALTTHYSPGLTALDTRWAAPAAGVMLQLAVSLASDSEV